MQPRSPRETPAFSNGTEGAAWMGTWCDTCVHDVDARRMDGPGCELVFIALEGKTPAEWIETAPFSLTDRYQCLMYRPEGGGGDTEPRPLPEPPGQIGLFPREPFTGTRMLTPLHTEVPAS
ncbi:hypothetical protein [Nocardiopsis synnemataformans]|uniref:hypothetical protein n=1 Tax=Nocardiopsis synnemataformans TaxID=61305 RepID=UPI003EBC2F78